MPSVATSRTPVYLGASLATAHVPVLTVCNHKGGTGKTTTSIHLAAALGRQGKRVLVVDLDPQGFLTRMLGAPEPPPEHSALGLLDGEADLRSFPVHSVSGFDLIGSSMALTRSLRRLTRPTDVLWLRETVRSTTHVPPARQHRSTRLYPSLQGKKWKRGEGERGHGWGESSEH